MGHRPQVLAFLLSHVAMAINPPPAPSTPEPVVCNERTPDCVVTHRLYTDQSYVFTTPGPQYVDYDVHILTVDASLPVCSLDPMLLMGDITNRSAPLSLRFGLTCQENSTRVVLWPSQNIAPGKAFAYVDISNCTVYWKDLARFGRHMDIKVLQLLNWADEFIDQKPDLFRDCVDLDYLQEEETEGDLAPPISGLAGVGSLRVSSSVACTCSGDEPVNNAATTSPVFTRHLWPVMAEVSFGGYPIDSYMLPHTMPKLQALEFRGFGQLRAPNVTFPWQPAALDLPLNLSRTVSFNDHYSSSLAIAHLPPNIYRRVLKLDSVIFPPAWNETFTGFLHKIQIIGCNLTRITSHTFRHIKGLQAIDVSRNQIDYLPESAFLGLTYLVTIDLCDNRITSLPGGIFHGLSSLANILLRGNLLTSIEPLTFANLHSLKRIDLSENQIGHVSEEAMGRESADFTQLTEVDLSKNELEDFPVWLLLIRFLSDVDLSHNRISFDGLKAMLSRISSVNMIQHANHQSSSATDNVFLPVTIKTINLQNNAFTNLNFSLMSAEEMFNFKLLFNYFQLNFGENDIHCNCLMNPLYNYLRNFDTTEPRDYNRIGVLPYNIDSMVCQEPLPLQGTPLVEAPVTSLGCFELVPRCPQDCQCWVRTIDEAIKVFCNNKLFTELPEFLPERAIELDFSGNLLVSLPRHAPDYISTLDVLDLSSNLLEHIGGSIFQILTNTTELNLHDNQLTTLPPEVDQMPRSLHVTLSDNRFICDCTSVWFKQWLVTRRHQILDIDEITCATGVPQGQAVIEVPDDEFVCVQDTTPVIVSVSIVAAVLALTLVALLLVYKYRGEIKIILYLKFGWHPFDCSDDTDIVGKEFDVFVSYCHEDNEWVCKELRPRLENAQPPFRLCLHERDFVAGAAVADNISAAISTSRRMVLLLSRSYLRSHWCYLEFRQAHYKVLKDRTNYLIVVLCDDISTEDLDEDMRLYLKTNTYVQRDCQWFWQKLHYALPQRPLVELEKTKDSRWKTAGWSGVEALAHAQNAAHKKAVETSHIENETGKHCCQYRKDNRCLSGNNNDGFCSHVSTDGDQCKDGIKDDEQQWQNGRKNEENHGCNETKTMHGKAIQKHNIYLDDTRCVGPSTVNEITKF